MLRNRVLLGEPIATVAVLMGSDDILLPTAAERLVERHLIGAFDAQMADFRQAA